MPHIHTEPGQHDHVVTAYIIRTDFEEPKALLHMHRKVHKLLPIGGHIELSETPWQAVTHELREESGYDIGELSILQPKDRISSLAGTVLHPQPVVMNTHHYTGAEHFHTDTVYGFVALAPPTHEIQAGESTDLRWYSRSELDSLDGNEAVLYAVEIYKRLLDSYLTTWEAVGPEHFH